ncbi:PREDICTED: uncharacterized protein LOC106809232 [Priapulus caudatus]|uniref:Uncharacterized protein LOC106809232 n=1 Tax=Priapulus caudatus TaxID=37621 RepID=A0ABM1E6A0_PRICU|nr:PREDICTED: uncharacterized protein LOC106809232 [Priapulus caudatus]
MPSKRRNPTSPNPKKKKTPAPVAGFRGRGRGRGGRGKELPSLDPAAVVDDAVVEDAVDDATRYPSSSHQGSPTHSRSGSLDSHASLASQASTVANSKKKDKKGHKLSDEEEELMVAFLEANEMLWNKKATHYRRPDMKNAAWQKQAETMSKEVSHLQGWFKGMRDNFARLDKLPKSGSGQRIFTERELWTLKELHFLKRITYHRPEPVSSVKDAIQAHSGDLSAAEAECARIGVEADAEEEEPQQASAVSGRGKGKGKLLEDAVMATLQKQLQETGQQVLQLQQKMQPQSPAEVFGTYVKGTLVNLSERKFKKARTNISRILEAAMEDSDEEEPPQVAPPSFWQGGHPRSSSAPNFSSSPKYVERWQPAQDCGYMERYQSSMANQMPPPLPGPPVPPAATAMSLPHISGISGISSLLETSRDS